MDEFAVVEGYVPGSLGQVAALHGSYYHEHWGFGLFFEAKVATDLAKFLVAYEPGRDGFWTVSTGDGVEASIAIDGSRGEEEGGRLRWFIVSDRLRGNGVGGRLLRVALGFCRSHGYPRVHLSTFAGLDAARHLYEREGFRLVEEHRGTRWGSEVLEQTFECTFDTSA